MLKLLPASDHVTRPNSNWPDVPESDLLIKMSAHDALLCAHNVITAGAGKHSLHTCTGETGNQWDHGVWTDTLLTICATTESTVYRIRLHQTWPPAKTAQSRTNFAAEVPQFECSVVAARDDASVVQKEARWQHLPTVTRQCVLEMKTHNTTFQIADHIKDKSERVQGRVVSEKLYQIQKTKHSI